MIFFFLRFQKENGFEFFCVRFGVDRIVGEYIVVVLNFVVNLYCL